MCSMSLCVCFAGVHNNTKPIQCHWRVKGGCTVRVVWGSAVGNAWEEGPTIISE